MCEALHEPILPTLAGLLAELPGPAPAHLLDLGCGAGNKAPLLQARWPQARVLGIDLARAQLQAARSQGYAALACCDASGLALRDASVDLVWCCATLGLLAEPLAALDEIHRVLRANGRLLLITATQRWTLPLDWPPELRAQLQKLRPAPWAGSICEAEIGREFEALLAGADLQALATRAWPLDDQERPGDELSLIDWERLGKALAPSLATRLGEACTRVAATAEPEMISLLIAILATKGNS